MTTKMITQTEQMLTRHLQAAAEEDIDRIMSNYDENSVLYTPRGVVRGLDQLRCYFEALFEKLPLNWFDSFAMVRREVKGNVAFIVWKAEPFIKLATDTIVVHDGKIRTQIVTGAATT